jgi:hypothetical protein
LFNFDSPENSGHSTVLRRQRFQSFHVLALGVLGAHCLLAANSSVTGSVVDDSGHPVAGVRVLISHAPSIKPPVAAPPVITGSLAAMVTADANGAFHAGGLAPDQYIACAARSGGSVTPLEKSLVGTRLIARPAGRMREKNTLVVLVGTGCPAANQVLRSYNELLIAPRKSARVIAVASGSVEDARKALASSGIQYQDLISARSLPVIVPPGPGLMLLDRRGRVVHAWIGRVRRDPGLHLAEPKLTAMVQNQSPR